MPMYTTEQIVFTLAWIAYRGDPLPFGEKLNAKLVLQTLKTKIHELQPLGDEWDVVWGPAPSFSPTSRTGSGSPRRARPDARRAA